MDPFSLLGSVFVLGFVFSFVEPVFVAGFVFVEPVPELLSAALGEESLAALPRFRPKSNHGDDSLGDSLEDPVGDPLETVEAGLRSEGFWVAVGLF